MEKNVVFCVDNRYLSQLDVAIKSLIAYNEDLNIYVVNADIPYEYFMKYQHVLNDTNNRVIDWKIEEEELKWDASFEYITKISYARLLIPEILPHLKRVVYLDCDIVVTDNIDQLFEIDLMDKAVGLVIDWLNFATATNRYNSGVMLFDCDVWRQNNYVSGLKEEIEKRVKFQEEATKALPPELGADDQHVVNAYFDYDNVYELPYEMNTQFGTMILGMAQYARDKFKEIKAGKIIHFTGPLKPWAEWGNMRGRQNWWDFHFMSVRDAVKMHQKLFEQRQMLVYTQSANIRGIKELAAANPKIDFIVVATTDVNREIWKLNMYPNIFVREQFRAEFFDFTSIKAILMLGEEFNLEVDGQLFNSDGQLFNSISVPILTYRDLALENVEYAYQAQDVKDLINKVKELTMSYISEK